MHTTSTSTDDRLELADTEPSPPPPPPPKRYPLSIADLGERLELAIREQQQRELIAGRTPDRTSAAKLLLAAGARALGVGATS